MGMNNHGDESPLTIRKRNLDDSGIKLEKEKNKIASVHACRMSRFNALNIAQKRLAAELRPDPVGELTAHP